jgi:type I site-specific restriction endonuclease
MANDRVDIRPRNLSPADNGDRWTGREVKLASGHGNVDYLLYVDGKAAGVIEAKKKGATLTGVEIQSSRYALGLPAALPAWRRPLPFVYESTGAERIVAEVERQLSVIGELEAQVDANLKRAVHLKDAVLRRAFSNESTQPQ